MKTIEQLKQEAREREEEHEAKLMEAEHHRIYEITRRNEALLEFLRSESTLGYGTDPRIGYDNGNDVVVTFHLSEHAQLQARYAFKTHDRYSEEAERWVPGPWYHEGFDKREYLAGDEFMSPDPKKLWRVLQYTGVKLNTGGGDDDGTYYATYKALEFLELGDALLAAERLYVPQEEIERQIQDANAHQKALADADEAETPLPNASQALLSALTDYIICCLDERVPQG